jgi:hypothetical protein
VNKSVTNVDLRSKLRNFRCLNLTLQHLSSLINVLIGIIRAMSNYVTKIRDLVKDVFLGLSPRRYKEDMTTENEDEEKGEAEKENEN